MTTDTAPAQCPQMLQGALWCVFPRCYCELDAEITKLRDEAASKRECQFPKCSCPGSPLDPVCEHQSPEPNSPVGWGGHLPGEIEP
jgi:hypothetical protein